MSKRLFAVIVIAMTLIAGLVMFILPSTEESKTGEDDASNSATSQSDASTQAPLTLPEREGIRRETSGTVPHIQIDAEPVAAIDAELRRRVYLLPGIEDSASDRSLPGARGLTFASDIEIVRPDVIAGSNEFAHIHPDGSLHVWLSVESAIEVDQKSWGELHPWVDRDNFWDGVAMVFTPQTTEELDVTIEIVVDAYNFVTGSTLEPSDIP